MREERGEREEREEKKNRRERREKKEKKVREEKRRKRRKKREKRPYFYNFIKNTIFFLIFSQKFHIKIDSLTFVINYSYYLEIIFISIQTLFVLFYLFFQQHMDSCELSIYKSSVFQE